MRPLPSPLHSVSGVPDAGTVAHAVVAHLAGVARDLPRHALTEQVIAAAGYLCNDPNRSRRRVSWTEAASGACAYLRLMPPPPPWVLLGAERDLGTGRADVTWEHPRLGVLVDELKTGRTALRDGSAVGIRQARRYMTALLADHGDRALGVRLFLAGNVNRSLLLQPDGALVPLFGSRYCPHVLAGGGQA